MGDIEKVERFITSDRKVHATLRQAKDWDDQLGRAEAATKLWETGMCMSVVLKRCFDSDCSEPLMMLTKDTMIAIPHWQCSDQPVYKVVRFMPGGGVYVHGAGEKYRNAYGNPMTIHDLERHYDAQLRREV